MFNKLKATLLAATVVLPSVISASALTAEMPIAISAPGVVAPISAATKEVVSDDELLQNAITAAKKYIGETDRFKSLSHSMSDYNGVKLVRLNWSGAVDSEENISVTIGSDGTLYTYSNNNKRELNKIPAATKANALDAAYAFVLKADPAYADCITKERATIEYSSYSGYSVMFQRVYNGYIVSDNTINVNVSGTGTVTEFNAMSMARGVVTPGESSPLITEDAARAALKTALPLELVYKAFYNYDRVYSKIAPYKYTAEIKLVYRLPGNYSKTVIDAVTGKPVELEYAAYDGGYMRADNAADKTMAAGAAMPEAKLTEAERKAVELQKGFLTAEQITEKLRAVAAFGLNTTYKLQKSNLYSSESPFTGATIYFWQLSYKSGSDDNAVYAYATVNAKTGEIISFSNNNSSEYKPASKFKYNEEESKSTAEKLLKELYGDKFAAYSYTDNIAVRPLDIAVTPDEPISSYTFNYVRHVNGVEFDTDTISVTVNPDTLAVYSMNFGYTDTTFPSVDGAIGADGAADKYVAITGMAPYYLASSEIKDGKLTLPGTVYSPDKKQLTPVFGYNFNCFIDAKSGAPLGYNGKPAEYKPAKYYDGSAGYTDLADSKFADAIKILSDMDVITINGTSFEPAKAITAGELRDMLQHAGCYYSSDDDKIDDKATVAMEDALYNVICALGYSEIASLDAIFKYPFDDAAGVSKERVGAFAIANGLGLLKVIADNNPINPTARLSRGEAAQLVYNLLARGDSPDSNMMPSPIIY